MLFRYLQASKFSVCLLSIVLATNSFAASPNFWQNEDKQTPLYSSPLTEKKHAQPTYYRIISLNTDLLTNLRRALIWKKAQLLLPIPEGGYSEFTVADAKTMPPELAHRYPNILSLQGYDAQGRNVRLDIFNNRLQAMVFDAEGNWLVKPSDDDNKNSNAYQSFRLEALPVYNAPPHEKLTPHNTPTISLIQSKRRSDENIHREYRIAVATTSDYTKKYGGTVAGGLANVVRTINQINQIYATDFGIHLILAKDNDKIIFTNPATDPYINAEDKREKNIIVLNSVIGAKNFDLGDLFSREIGGGASNGIVCQARKADSSSGTAMPAADGVTPLPPEKDMSEDVYALLVAHEIGHQFNANHTFNGCNRDAQETAVAPGSGSTIMSYAGECYSYTLPVHQNMLHNLQDHKDPYFNAINIAEIKAYISSGAGAECGKKLANPNKPPVIEPRSTAPFGKRQLTIPAHTPFVLHGYAHAYNRNAKLTYTWEELDLGPEQPVDSGLKDLGKGPIFRSYLPNISGERIFPRLAAVLGKESLGLGEVYPATTRQLHFRLTVRDNLQAQATTAYADMLLNVLDTRLNFAIAPVTTQWKRGKIEWVNWNVAGSNHEPIACKTVRVDLSLDGGYTYLAKSLAAKAANIGSVKILVPSTDKDVSTARLRVSCNENLFFAVSPKNFTIIK